MTAEEELNILVLDDVPIFLNGIKTLLAKYSTATNVYTATNSDVCKSYLEQNAIDIVLLDLDLGSSSEDGFQLARWIKKACPQTKIIVLTVNVKVQYVEYLMDDVGVEGYLDKSVDKRELFKAIDNVRRGECYLPCRIKEMLERGRYFQISAREEEVLRLLAAGLMKKEIADELFLSVHTIDTHVRNLFDKLKAKNAADLVAKYSKYQVANEENPDDLPPFKQS